MGTFRYYDVLQKFAELLKADSGFADWHVITDPNLLQPEMLPAIELHEGRVRRVPQELPGWKSGQQQIDATFLLRFVAFSPSANDARKTIQDGLDAFEAFIKANSNLDKMVDQLTSYEGELAVGSEPELEGLVAVAEITVNAVKFV